MRPAGVVEDVQEPRRVHLLLEVDDDGDDVCGESVHVQGQPGVPPVPPGAVHSTQLELEAAPLLGSPQQLQRFLFLVLLSRIVC